MIRSLVKKGEYFDSVSLMIVGKEVAKLEGVQDATVVMATAENKAILQTANLYLDEFAAYSDTDLLIVIKTEKDELIDEIFAAVEQLLSEIRQNKDEGGSFTPKSLEGALNKQPESNLALISLAGRFAGKEAMKALRQGLHVMLFSDNVSLETELELKRYAVQNKLLVMGPDCGTAIINQVPLAFSNVVNKGNIGLVAASGTGLQEVTSIISEEGFGISQAIGTGGRDIKKEVGGLMFLAALDLLAADEETKVIVLISKPPDAEVLTKINNKISKISKPVVAIFLGADEKMNQNNHLIWCKNLQEAALKTCAIANNSDLQEVDKFLESQKKESAAIAEKVFSQIGEKGKYLRGLFTGGTLCDEMQIILQEAGIEIYSNRAREAKYKLADNMQSQKHTLLDLGEDEFTVGRLHPMMDFELRNKRILQEAKDPETAIIFLDLVLGYGAHPDPLAENLPIIKQAQEIAPQVLFICSVTGTAHDPQNREKIIQTLQENNVVVLPSNAAAAETVKELIKKIER
jgi:succinyl-CoA synthetase alpha subunit